MACVSEMWVSECCDSSEFEGVSMGMDVGEWPWSQSNSSLYGHEGYLSVWNGVALTGICVVVVVFAFAFQ